MTVKELKGLLDKYSDDYYICVELDNLNLECEFNSKIEISTLGQYIRLHLDV